MLKFSAIFKREDNEDDIVKDVYINPIYVIGVFEARVKEREGWVYIQTAGAGYVVMGQTEDVVRMITDRTRAMTNG